MGLTVRPLYPQAGSCWPVLPQARLEAAARVGLLQAQEPEVVRLKRMAARGGRAGMPQSSRGGLGSRSGTVKGSTRARTKVPWDETAAKPDQTLERRTSELNGRLVVEVKVRARAPWLRCALAPHATEVSIFRPESRYHRLVFTVPEWDTFLADVKTGLYDVVSAP